MTKTRIEGGKMKKAKKKNSILRIMLIVIAAIILAIALFIGIFFHWANNVELKMVHKTHFDFVVSPGQIVDYRAFINPQESESTRALRQIPSDIRLRIAEYMKDNNLKLTEGHHYFNRVDGTYEGYINEDFSFEELN